MDSLASLTGGRAIARGDGLCQVPQGLAGKAIAEVEIVFVEAMDSSVEDADSLIQGKADNGQGIGGGGLGGMHCGEWRLTERRELDFWERRCAG